MGFGTLALYLWVVRSAIGRFSALVRYREWLHDPTENSGRRWACVTTGPGGRPSLLSVMMISP